MFFKRAFTLAEILITLGILGVVAAITIPTLISTTRKKILESQIKADYSLLQQTFKYANNEEVPISNFTDGNSTEAQNLFKSYILPHLRVEQVCYNQPGCWHKPGIVKDMKNIKPVYDQNQGPGLNIVTARLSNGSFISFDVWSIGGYLKDTFGIDSNNNVLIIAFDANGDKKPNIIGKDIHFLAFVDEQLVPAGHYKSSTQVKVNCETGNGYWCLKDIINNGFTISDKSWKR